MNGAAESGSGNVKVTREDWLKAALEVLVSDGVEQVKVLTLGARLGVSRSSFYWYFKSRQDLLDALLDHWMATNTRALVAQAEAPAETITGAVCNVFRCMVSDALFDTRLDFAIRDWARRAATVRRVLELSDTQRVQALASMFRRFGYDGTEAFVRARVLYYMQVGYDDADLNETLAERLRLVPHYLRVFTGTEPREEEIRAFTEAVTAIETGEGHEQA